jgi:hypothetical protein
MKPLTPYQKREIIRLRGAGYDFKTIDRIVGSGPRQASNLWYNMPFAKRVALTKTPASRYSREAEMARARKALQHEITLARQERATAPPFKVSPLLW